MPTNNTSNNWGFYTANDFGGATSQSQGLGGSRTIDPLASVRQALQQELFPKPEKLTKKEQAALADRQEKDALFNEALAFQNSVRSQPFWQQATPDRKRELLDLYEKRIWAPYAQRRWGQDVVAANSLKNLMLQPLRQEAADEMRRIESEGSRLRGLGQAFAQGWESAKRMTAGAGVAWDILTQADPDELRASLDLLRARQQESAAADEQRRKDNPRLDDQMRRWAELREDNEDSIIPALASLLRENPSYAPSLVAQQWPQFLGQFAAQGGAQAAVRIPAAMVGASGGPAGVVGSQIAVTPAATMASAIAGAAMGAAQSVSGGADEVIARIMDLPEEELVKLPNYEALKAEGLSNDEIRRRMSVDAVRNSAPYLAALGGLSGVFGVERLITTPGSAVARAVSSVKSPAGRVAVGAGIGAVSEALEEGAEQIAQNYGYRAATGSTESLFHDVGDAMVAGALPGAFLGGGGSFVRNQLSNWRRNEADRVLNGSSTTDGSPQTSTADQNAGINVPPGVSGIGVPGGREAATSYNDTTVETAEQGLQATIQARAAIDELNNSGQTVFTARVLEPVMRHIYDVERYSGWTRVAPLLEQVQRVITKSPYVEQSAEQFYTAYRESRANETTTQETTQETSSTAATETTQETTQEEFPQPYDLDDLIRLMNEAFASNFGTGTTESTMDGFPQPYSMDELAQAISTALESGAGVVNTEEVTDGDGSTRSQTSEDQVEAAGAGSTSSSQSETAPTLDGEVSGSGVSEATAGDGGTTESTGTGGETRENAGPVGSNVQDDQSAGRPDTVRADGRRDNELAPGTSPQPNSWTGSLAGEVQQRAVDGRFASVVSRITEGNPSAVDIQQILDDFYNERLDAHRTEGLDETMASTEAATDVECALYLVEQYRAYDAATTTSIRRQLSSVRDKIVKRIKQVFSANNRTTSHDVRAGSILMSRVNATLASRATEAASTVLERLGVSTQTTRLPQHPSSATSMSDVRDTATGNNSFVAAAYQTFVRSLLRSLQTQLVDTPQGRALRQNIEQFFGPVGVDGRITVDATQMLVDLLANGTYSQEPTGEATPFSRAFTDVSRALLDYTTTYLESLSNHLRITEAPYTQTSLVDHLFRKLGDNAFTRKLSDVGRSFITSYLLSADSRLTAIWRTHPDWADNSDATTRGILDGQFVYLVNEYMAFGTMTTEEAFEAASERIQEAVLMAGMSRHQMANYTTAMMTVRAVNNLAAIEGQATRTAQDLSEGRNPEDGSTIDTMVAQELTRDPEGQFTGLPLYSQATMSDTIDAMNRTHRPSIHVLITGYLGGYDAAAGFVRSNPSYSEDTAATDATDATQTQEAREEQAREHIESINEEIDADPITTSTINEDNEISENDVAEEAVTRIVESEGEADVITPDGNISTETTGENVYDDESIQVDPERRARLEQEGVITQSEREQAYAESRTQAVRNIAESILVAGELGHARRDEQQEAFTSRTYAPCDISGLWSRITRLFRRTFVFSGADMVDWIVSHFGASVGDPTATPLAQAFQQMPGRIEVATTHVMRNAINPLIDWMANIANTLAIDTEAFAKDIGLYRTALHTIEASYKQEQELIENIQRAYESGNMDQVQEARIAYTEFQQYQENGPLNGRRVAVYGGRTRNEATQLIARLEEKYGRALCEEATRRIGDAIHWVTMYLAQNGCISESDIRSYGEWNWYCSTMVKPESSEDGTNDIIYFAPRNNMHRNGSRSPADDSFTNLIRYATRAARSVGMSEFSVQLKAAYDYLRQTTQPTRRQRNIYYYQGLALVPSSQVGILANSELQVDKDFASSITRNSSAVIRVLETPSTMERVEGQRVAVPTGEPDVMSGYYVLFDQMSPEHKRVGEAMRDPLSVNSYNALVNTIATLTRIRGSYYTRMRPLFPVVNSMRDTGERITYLMAMDFVDTNGQRVSGLRVAARMLAFMANPINAYRLFRHRFRGSSGSAAFDTLMSNFAASGLEGSNNYSRLTQIGRTDMQNHISRVLPYNVRKALGIGTRPFRAFLDFMGNVNSCFYNVAAVAQMQAMLASNIDMRTSVDVTRGLMDLSQRGKWTRALSTIFPFVSSIFQTSANLLGVLGVNRFTFSPTHAGFSARRAAKAWATLVVATSGASLLIPFIVDSLGDDDDQNQKIWDATPLEMLTKGFPVGNGEGGFYSIPVGFGIPQLAMGLAFGYDRVSRGVMASNDFAAYMLMTVAKTLTPNSAPAFAFSEDPIAFIAQTVSPLLISTEVELATNRSFSGVRITYDTLSPGERKSDRANMSTNPVWKELAQAIYEHTGLDFSPEQVRTFVNGHLDGALQIIAGAIESAPLYESAHYKTTRDVLGPFWTAMGASIVYSNGFNVSQRFYFQAQEHYNKLMEKAGIGRWFRGDEEARLDILLQAGFTPDEAQDIVILHKARQAVAKLDQETRAKLKYLEGPDMDLGVVRTIFNQWDDERNVKLDQVWRSLNFYNKANIRRFTAHDPAAMDVINRRVPGQTIERANATMYTRVPREDGKFRDAPAYVRQEVETGAYVLVPAFDAAGNRLSENDAWSLYLRTQEHFGKYNNRSAAESYVRSLVRE